MAILWHYVAILPYIGQGTQQPYCFTDTMPSTKTNDGKNLAFLWMVIKLFKNTTITWKHLCRFVKLTMKIYLWYEHYICVNTAPCSVMRTEWCCTLWWSVVQLVRCCKKVRVLWSVVHCCRVFSSVLIVVNCVVSCSSVEKYCCPVLWSFVQYCKLISGADFPIFAEALCKV